MSLHVEVTGSGAPLVMLHGWGMHGGIWRDAAEMLAADFQVHNVDLPGHGQSTFPSPAGGRGAGGEGGAESSLSLTLSRQRERGLGSLDFIVNELSSAFPEPINLCGWSLGGIIAQHWAVRAPEQVRRLVLVSSTPCFAARADWAFGMPQETLAQFAAELEQNHSATLRRFLALQVRGSEGERELLGALREKLFSRGEPRLEALRGGLAILRDADLRDALPQIAQPTLVIAGERDKLTPPEASRYLAQSLPHARAVVVAGAAHAPFLSHPEIFVEQVHGFLKNN
ncbi:MAG: alpha/beta fold hydrolase [Nitrosomonadales bacterium]|nr:alpha/beta fold hydrolase [Nitrosomonadales bacterium]